MCQGYSGQGSRDPSELVLTRHYLLTCNCMEEATCGIPISHVKQIHNTNMRV